jgi:hypothetical protein
LAAVFPGILGGCIVGIDVKEYENEKPKILRRKKVLDQARNKIQLQYS